MEVTGLKYLLLCLDNAGIIGGDVALYYPLVSLVGNNISSLEPNLRFDLISKNGTILYSNSGAKLE